jgi:hypothetical protein
MRQLLHVSGIIKIKLRWRPSTGGKHNILATADAQLVFNLAMET